MTFQQFKRIVAIPLFCALFVWRIVEYPHFYSKTLWFLECMLYAVLVFNYVTRLPVVSSAQGFYELVVPYVAAATPFVVFFLPVNPAVRHFPQVFLAGQCLLIVGTLLTVVGMATLGRSFSISVEARALVTHGIYRWMRHPIYVGECVAVTGVAVIRFHMAAFVVVATFVVLQMWRARLEERKLGETFEEYAKLLAKK